MKQDTISSSIQIFNQGPPPEQIAEVSWEDFSGKLKLVYHGATIFDGKVTGDTVLTQSVEEESGITQRLIFSGKNIHILATVAVSDEGIAAETKSDAQKKFPLVRTSHGLSSNLRNNAIYDRKWDWELDGESESIRIVPMLNDFKGRLFKWESSGDRIILTFRPRYYQKQKGIKHFEPWTYKVREDSITGWSSWWAYFRNFSQKNCDDLLAVWKEKRLNDFGYKFIQIDDCFQSDLGENQQREQYPGSCDAYPSRGAETWLEWRTDFYPDGIDGFSTACKTAGFKPGIWVGCHTSDKELIESHPDWFISDDSGNPFVGPWVSCGIDTTNKDAIDALVRPTFAGIRRAEIPYVKIDLLRHYLYDVLHNNLEYCKQHDTTPEEMFRKYLSAAREEVGPDTFILSCWGVLPETVGIVDACRIGGDGYGPVTMQQYNSWNGIVWRNDPDHCDVYPHFKPAEEGNVIKLAKTTPDIKHSVIRPALASISGSMLLLSDNPEVYRDDHIIEGAKRSSPVMFSLPGQLYDFDDKHSSTIKSTPRESIIYGGDPVLCDADQFGVVCQWWLNEINLPAVGHWNVLHRVNWEENSPAVTVSFAELGLESDTDYLIYEFWTAQFQGIKRGQIEMPEAYENDLASYAIRKLESHPQIVSTNRHLSQGGVDLIEVKWDGMKLSGISNVVQNDRYELAVHIPAGYQLVRAEFDSNPAASHATADSLLRADFVPTKTGEVQWEMFFSTAG